MRCPPNDNLDNPGGDGFTGLHEWFVGPDGELVRPSVQGGELYDEIMDGAGAVLAGRLSIVTYVLDGIESAMARAKAAAGNGYVLVAQVLRKQ